LAAEWTAWIAGLIFSLLAAALAVAVVAETQGSLWLLLASFALVLPAVRARW